MIGCPSCGESAPEDAKWCEACGQDLNAEPLPVCVSCGEREVAEEGYCLSCGHKQPEERDHMEVQEGTVVAATDRGKRHRHNEDAFAIASTAGGGAVMVVCDGVSSTPGSAEASLRAANAARDLLVTGIDLASGSDSVEELAPDASALLIRAVEAAQVEATSSAESEGASEHGPSSDGGPPSSTFVAVVAIPTTNGFDITTAWVGDSRAYWVGEEPALLTGSDHEIGGSLVRWLGADSIDPTPEIATLSTAEDGYVIVCTDGLWRYASEPSELSELVERLTADGQQGVELAASMVDFANDGGGHDNITVAVWPTFQPAAESPDDESADNKNTDDKSADDKNTDDKN